MSISYGPELKPSPSYQLVVTEIDRLVAKIFEICSRNPKFFTGSMSSYIRDAMIHGNPVSEFLFESA